MVEALRGAYVDNILRPRLEAPGMRVHKLGGFHVSVSILVSRPVSLAGVGSYRNLTGLATARIDNMVYRLRIRIGGLLNARLSLFAL
jgi:hypothetical protein